MRWCETSAFFFIATHRQQSSVSHEVTLVRSFDFAMIVHVNDVATEKVDQ